MCGHAVNRAANADDFPGVHAGINSGPGIVAHHAADELHACGNFLIPIDHVDGAVSVLQITVASAGSQVDPASDVAVTQKAKVLFVGPGLGLNSFDFTAHLASVGNRDRILDRTVFTDF